jgi:hypothetical protein
MVQMLGIFVMAAGSRLVLGEEVPPLMWLALTVSVAGSTMVLVGQSEAHSHTSSQSDSTGAMYAVSTCMQLFMNALRLRTHAHAHTHAHTHTHTHSHTHTHTHSLTHSLTYPPPLPTYHVVIDGGTSQLAVTDSHADSTDSYDVHRDIIGVLIQCASLFFSTCARLQMRISEGRFVSTFWSCVFKFFCRLWSVV